MNKKKVIKKANSTAKKTTKTAASKQTAKKPAKTAKKKVSRKTNAKKKIVQIYVCKRWS